jgi:flagellar biosynthesis/type III secretory pathway protein FliH
MDKLHYSELSGLTQFYISELCKKYNINNYELEDFILGLLADYRDNAFDEGFEQGRSEGDDEGYERGRADGDDYTNEDFIEKDEALKNEKEAYYDGYRKGYLTGIDWKEPEFDDLKGY